MSIQAVFDKEAIDMLPKIKDILNNAQNEERNQMLHITLRECMLCHPTLVDMNSDQLEKFQDYLIKKFEYKEYI